MQDELNEPSQEELRRIFQLKYGKPEELYWGPAMRWKFGYFNPDDWYETLVDNLVTEDTKWLDVGSGRDIFPSNRQLAAELSARCELLVGVDPDSTIQENPFLHEKKESGIEEFAHEEKFDLITMRMVAEHIDDPQSTIAAIVKYANPGASVVIYTVNKYSPVPLFTRLIPIKFRHVIKRILWDTEEKDTFPTRFRLNSRKEIDMYLSSCGLREALFLRLDDCRSFARWRPTLFLELLVRKILHTFRIAYPENCLLVVHRKPYNVCGE